MLKKKSISFDDCLYLTKLLARDIAFADALSLICNKQNKEAIKYLDQGLKQGEEFDNLFKNVCPKMIWRNLEGFISFLPFAKALELAINFVQIEKQKRKNLERTLMYPFCLVFLVLIGSFGFSYFILPMMTKVIESFTVENDILYQYDQKLHLFWFFMLTIFILLIFLYFLFKCKKWQVIFYRICTKIFPHSYYVQKGSLEFIQYYIECLRLHQSSRESFQILSKLKEQCLVQYIANEFDRLLKMGISFKVIHNHRIVEPHLQRFFKISYYFKDTVVLLERYIEIAQEKQNKCLKKFSFLLQISAYFQIVYLLILMYQVILFPMQFMQ